VCDLWINKKPLTSSILPTVQLCGLWLNPFGPSVIPYETSSVQPAVLIPKDSKLFSHLQIDWANCCLLINPREESPLLLLSIAQLRCQCPKTFVWPRGRTLCTNCKEAVCTYKKFLNQPRLPFIIYLFFEIFTRLYYSKFYLLLFPVPWRNIFSFFPFIHMFIQCLGHFSPLLPTSSLSPLLLSSPLLPPSLPGRNYLALISNFVEERV
jgi:hypothetical protein